MLDFFKKEQGDTAKQDIETNFQRKLQWLVDLFVKNSYAIIKENSNVDEEKYVRSMRSFIEQEINQQVLYGRFCSGEFDQIIFGNNPSLTKELEFFMKGDNRTFIQRLFTKCSSRSTLCFWMANGAKLPEDSIALAVHLHSKKVVFEYLHETCWPKEICSNDKDVLLKRAKSTLDEEAFNYLNDMFNSSVSSGSDFKF